LCQQLEAGVGLAAAVDAVVHALSAQ
jgi:hypothetical protein